MYVRSIHKPESQATGSTPRNSGPVRICQIPGCSLEIPGGHLMCKAHWFEVPAEIREGVVATLAGWLKGEHPIWAYSTFRFRALIHVCKLHRIETTALEAQLDRLYTRTEEGK